MRRATLVFIAVSWLHHGEASANECNAFVPHTSTADVPLGCPLLVVGPTSDPYTPQVQVTRYDPHTGAPTTIDVTGAITRDADLQLPVEMYRYHGCDLVDDGPQAQPYALYEVALQGVEIGDVLRAGPYDGSIVHVVVAGPCPAFAAPPLACAEPIQSCADAGVSGDSGGSAGNGGGCNTGGSTGSGIALALLAIVRRRR